jgi:AcrR family transcriptional regulator
MARKTKAEAAETRRQIILAAIDAFYEHGVSKTSLDEIAQRASVTRGAVYWHFKNKLDIIEALYDELHESVTESILADLDKLDDLDNPVPDPLHHLELLCTQLLIDVKENPVKHSILTLFFLKCDYSGEMEVVLEKQRQGKMKSVELFTQYFDRAITSGQLAANTNARTLSIALSCYLTGIVYEVLRTKDLFDLRTSAGDLMRQFFAGVKSG